MAFQHSMKWILKKICITNLTIQFVCVTLQRCLFRSRILLKSCVFVLFFPMWICLKLCKSLALLFSDSGPRYQTGPSPLFSHRQTRLPFASPARCAATSGTGGCLWRCGTGTARPGTTSWGRCRSAWARSSGDPSAAGSNCWPKMRASTTTSRYRIRTCR